MHQRQVKFTLYAELPDKVECVRAHLRHGGPQNEVWFTYMTEWAGRRTKDGRFAPTPRYLFFFF